MRSMRFSLGLTDRMTADLGVNIRAFPTLQQDQISPFGQRLVERMPGTLGFDPLLISPLYSDHAPCPSC